MPATPLNLLVVDDDDVDRERVRRFLARGTLVVDIVEAASGAEALALVRDRPFDCVLLDNQLGDTSGRELMPRLHRASQQAFPIVFVTGAGDEALAVHVLHEGAADYLPKPRLSAESLARAIRRSVDQHQRLSANAEQQRLLAWRADHQAEELRRRERDLLALVEHSPIAMGRWDTALNCRFGNSTLARWLGLAPEALRGLPLERLLGPALGQALAPTLHRTLDGEAGSFDITLPARGDEPERPVHVQLSADHDEQGAIEGFYLSFTDIGAHRLAETRIDELLSFNEAVIEHSPIGIAVFGPDGLCVLANATFEALAGNEALARLRREDLRGQPAWQASGLAAAAAQTLLDAQPRRGEFTLDTGSSEHRVWACALAKVDRGQVPHLLLIASDIGEQRRAQEALVQARDAAQAAARAKSAFLANISHEIRTPMSAIIGLSRLAMEDGPHADSRLQLQRVYRSAVALMALLDEVLDYSKIEADGLHIESLPFELSATLAQVVELFDAQAAQQGITLALELARELPRRVQGDPLRLSQVLNNMVGNALKFTEQGWVVLRVMCDADPDRLRFEVEDSGIGIGAAAREALFQPFVQADQTITRRFGGSGLGLAISRRLVELMGGTIGVESEPGRGSRFWFVLALPPAPPPAPGETGVGELSEPAAGLSFDALSRLVADAEGIAGGCVLVVDDNPVNLLIAQEYLHRVGITSEVASDGEQAVQAVAAAPAGHFMLVLMDLHMAGVDGLEATRRILALPGAAGLPIVAMTAAALPEDRARSLEAGMVDHLAKPVLPEQLVRTVLARARPSRQALKDLPDPPTEVRPAPATGTRVADGGGGGDLEFAALLQRCSGARPHAAPMGGSFVAHESGTTEMLREAWAQGDVDVLRRVAHDLRGSASNLAATTTAAAAAALERTLAGLAEQAEAGAAVQALTSALEADLAAMRRWLAA